jgi:glutamate N-acetyltransferase/amino-acid N-acetyltransferase
MSTESTPSPLPVAGIRLATVRAGIKYPDRRDLVVIEAAPGSTAAAVFTRNAFCAAPVTLARQHLAMLPPRYLVINTGNANAGTGRQGWQDAVATCEALARLAGCRTEAVLPFSTGVIGEPLPLARLLAGLPAALADLRADGWADAACGIMTTDTRPKAIAHQCQIDGHTVTLTGIAKGAGMICPNMATMLAFIATDAALPAALLQSCLNEAVADSFNAITVDGDTSTNDAGVLLASGQAGVRISGPGVGLTTFSDTLNDVCGELARALVRDGEGATKFVTIRVEGGWGVAECRQVAYTIAHSPLVKTALFASDPNWGRILAAVGRAGLDELQVDRVVIHLDEVCIVRDGGRALDYSEEQGRRVLAQTEFTIRVQLGRGAAAARVWTTDLSYDYVRINAEYRT